MQYIDKTNTEPAFWAAAFSHPVTGIPIYDFRAIGGVQHIVKQHLVDEQNGLCAYCQREITVANMTTEHVVPYSQALWISTSYHNLVAVCANFTIDKGKLHCDKSRQNLILSPIIFHKDFTCPGGASWEYFEAKDDGSIVARPFTHRMDWNIHMQITSAIEILNLNHYNLKKKREDILKQWLSDLLGKTRREIRNYLTILYNNVNGDLRYPFRQFFLIYLTDKLK